MNLEAMINSNSMKKHILGIAVCLLVAAARIHGADATLMQQVFMVKQAFPNLKTIGILCHTEHVAEPIKAMSVACAAYQVNLRVFHTATLQDVRDGFDKMVKADKIDLIWILPDDVTSQKFGRRFLAEKCMAMKIPLCVYSPDLVREGALLSIGASEDGTLRIFFNEKVGGMMSVTLPAEILPKVVSVR